MIEITDLSVEYESGGDNEKVINGLNLSLNRGDSLGVIGPNGCGKTTLLHTIAGLHENYSGLIRVNTTKDKIALILQDIGLLPWKTIWKNATLGLDLGRQGDEERVEDLLHELDLYSYRDSYPAQLSGGQKRKLGLARALAVDPEILLMDEPFVSLDEFTRESLQDKVLKLWQDRNLTLTLVTHDMEEVAFLGRNIAVLSQVPASVKTWVENQKMGTEGFRRSEEFYRVVRKTRQELP
ncbi:MAG: ATP-binding cassette domain-containing protein [Candidatus Bipolaricaulota bacterium]|nr:ATP-binding cassette domain-containing protein [Candidatus Bipolaricaulota bacterium]MBS3791917.1 ATP-binding cassette domain-containing protein [Candidatus Bipolaricaulota bacterium]